MFSGDLGSESFNYISAGTTNTILTSLKDSVSDPGGTITKVELGFWGYHPDLIAATMYGTFQPIIGGTPGDYHQTTNIGYSAAEFYWVDITSDSQAPGTWTWSDINNLNYNFNVTHTICV